MKAIARQQNILGAILLVSGCCIGAGMIGLPLISKSAGFLPSFAAMIFAYFLTTVSGLLLLEATLWFQEKVNLFSIAQFALGRVGKWVAGTMFFLLFTCIFIAYIDACGHLMALGVAALTYAGTRFVDGINRALMIGLGASFCVMLFVGVPHVQLENLARVNWTASLATIPILLICFGYQNLVPSLTYYLNKNVNALRIAIILGNFLPLLFYFLWNFTILGQGDHLVPASSFTLQAFAFFALATSFITTAISFVDFMKDGVKRNELTILLFVFVPPMVFSYFFKNIFLKALSFAGGVVDVILFGLLPPMIVYIGRYIKKADGPYKVGGGKILLIAIFALSVGILSLQIFF